MRAQPSALAPPVRGVALSKTQQRVPLGCLAFRRADAELRDAIQEALRDELFDHQEGLSAARAAELSYERARFIVHRLRSLSFEIERDPASLFLLHELLGPVDGTACTILGIHYCLAIGSITALGQNKTELAPILDELLEMKSVGVFLATELGYGNSVMSLETTAHYVHETREFVLNSPSPKSRKFMPNTAFPVGKIAVVLAQLVSEGRVFGVFPFVVRIRDDSGRLMPGVRVTALTEKPGYSLDNGITAFEGVRVPKALWLSGPESEIDDSGKFHSRIPSRRGRFLVAMDRVQTGRVCFTSGAAALLRSATWIATRYAAQRLVSSPRGKEVLVLRYRNVQADLFRALSEAYALTFAVRSLQRSFVERPLHRETFNDVAVLKVTISERVSELLPRLRERCGAVGMLSSNRIIDYWVQTQGIITAEGDNHLMLLKVGRTLLDAPESDMSSAGPPPVFDLAKPASLLELSRYRESCLLTELRARIARSRSRSRDPFVIWNDNVSAVMDLARAFGARIVAEKFHEALCGLEPKAQAAVLPLLQLWNLNEVRSNAAWFLAEGCIADDWYRNIAEHTQALLAIIEQHVEGLLGGLEIHDEILRAPITTDYVEHYENLAENVPPSRERYGRAH
jgi:acyl-CoA oxidase